MKKTKKLISLLLVLVMIVTAVPITMVSVGAAKVSEDSEIGYSPSFSVISSQVNKAGIVLNMTFNESFSSKSKATKAYNTLKNNYKVQYFYWNGKSWRGFGGLRSFSVRNLRSSLDFYERKYFHLEGTASVGDKNVNSRGYEYYNYIVYNVNNRTKAKTVVFDGTKATNRRSIFYWYKPIDFTSVKYNNKDNCFNLTWNDNGAENFKISFSGRGGDIWKKHVTTNRFNTLNRPDFQSINKQYNFSTKKWECVYKCYIANSNGTKLNKIPLSFEGTFYIESLEPFNDYNSYLNPPPCAGLKNIGRYGNVSMSEDDFLNELKYIENRGIYSFGGKKYDCVIADVMSKIHKDLPKNCYYDKSKKEFGSNFYTKRLKKYTGQRLETGDIVQLKEDSYVGVKEGQLGIIARQGSKHTYISILTPNSQNIIKRNSYMSLIPGISKVYQMNALYISD